MPNSKSKNTKTSKSKGTNAAIGFSEIDFQLESQLLFAGAQPIVFTPGTASSEVAAKLCDSYRIPPTERNLAAISLRIDELKRRGDDAVHFSTPFKGNLVSVIFVDRPIRNQRHNINPEHFAYTQFVHELTHYYLLDYLGIRDLIFCYLDDQYLLAQQQQILEGIAKRSHTIPSHHEQLLLRLTEQCLDPSFKALESIERIEYIKTALFRLKLYERFGIDISLYDRVPFEEEVCELVACLATARRYKLDPTEYLRTTASYWFKNNIDIATRVQKTEDINVGYRKLKAPDDLFAPEANHFMWQDWAEDISDMGKYQLFNVLFPASKLTSVNDDSFDYSSGINLLASCIRYVAQIYTPKADFLKTFRIAKEHGLYAPQKPIRLKSAKSVIEQISSRPELICIRGLAEYIAHSHSLKP